MKWREITEVKHRRMLEAARRKHPDTGVAVLEFDGRFCQRPLLVQLPLFPELVRPACWTPREQHNYRIG